MKPRKQEKERRESGGDETKGRRMTMTTRVGKPIRGDARQESKKARERRRR